MLNVHPANISSLIRLMRDFGERREQDFPIPKAAQCERPSHNVIALRMHMWNFEYHGTCATKVFISPRSVVLFPTQEKSFICTLQIDIDFKLYTTTQREIRISGRYLPWKM